MTTPPPLPPSGLASDLLDALPAPDPKDPQPLLSFVRAVGPSARAPSAAPEQTEHLVTFELEGSPYAVRLSSVREIVRATQITPVPQAPRHVRGVQNLRGAILPVLEVRTRLGLPPAFVGPASRVIVAEAGERLVGLLVDAVHRVAQVPTSRISPPPPELRSQLSAWVLGVADVAGRTTLLLDLDSLLTLAPSGDDTP